MYLDSDNRRPALTPQLAWRVAILGGVALIAFAVIFFRLWYLQVLSGNKYVAEARNNQVREIKVRAPRIRVQDCSQAGPYSHQLTARHEGRARAY